MNESRAILIVDLAFGDCGKGTIADFLTRHTSAHAVVRFNGGPQAAHHVVTPDGRCHAFAQFGSGAFIPGVRTLLSRFMLIEPYALLNEANHLADIGVAGALDRLDIDARCPVITPAHQAANRLREIARGDLAHGTCGMGIGETMQDILQFPELMLRAADLSERTVVERKLRAICDLKADQLREVLLSVGSTSKAQSSASTLLDRYWIPAAVDNYAEVARHANIVDPAEASQMICKPGTILFEGAQGVLLDQTFGFHPHTTWSDTTFANAQTLLDEAGHRAPRTRLGVLRTYFTRHGAGPFVTEDSSLRAALPELHNTDAGWQGRFRVGVFDAVAARYAIAVSGGVDALAITHVDRLDALPPKICTAYADDSHGDASETRSADDVFVRRSGRIIDIRADRRPEAATSDVLSKSLASCRPINENAPTETAETFIKIIQSELGVPVGIISAGPTAENKSMLMPQLFGRRRR